VAGLPLDTIALPRLVLTVSFGIWEHSNHSVADSGGPGINAVIVALADAFYEAAVPFADHPVVVQGTEKDDRARSRFDGAQELGHLVVHGKQIWGAKEVETQAHQFAAEFLPVSHKDRVRLWGANTPSRQLTCDILSQPMF
jgi:hypothetical protein